MELPRLCVHGAACRLQKHTLMDPDPFVVCSMLQSTAGQHATSCANANDGPLVVPLRESDPLPLNGSPLALRCACEAPFDAFDAFIIHPAADIKNRAHVGELSLK